MCFIHSDSDISRRHFIQQFSLGAAAAAAIADVGTRLAEASEGFGVGGAPAPDVTVAAAQSQPQGGVKTLDGFSKVCCTTDSIRIFRP